MEFRAERIFLFYYGEMRSVHTKVTKATQRTSCNLRVLCGGLLFCAAILSPAFGIAQATPAKQKIICDHAAPPRGMHYVCKSQCDCHLEGKLKNDEDGVAAAAPQAPSEDLKITTQTT